jgi:hypothetical protein
MKTKTTIQILLLVVSFFSLSFDPPAGWFKAGTDPDKYDMGVDTIAGYSGGSAATIKSTLNKINGYGTLMQNSKSDKFLGKRIRMSCWLKTKNVVNWASLWFRVDGLNSNIPLAFDNMRNRPVSGTADWRKYDIVIDVAPNASNLAYGALLYGTGQIWFSNITFETVDNSVQTTDLLAIPNTVQTEPTNLNFEKK